MKKRSSATRHFNVLLLDDESDYKRARARTSTPLTSMSVRELLDRQRRVLGGGRAFAPSQAGGGDDTLTSVFERMQIDQLIDVLLDEGRLEPHTVGVSSRMRGLVDEAMSRPHFFRDLTRRCFPAMRELPFDAAYYLAQGRYGNPASVAAQNAAWRAHFARTTALFADAKLVVNASVWLLHGGARTISARVDNSFTSTLSIDTATTDYTTDGPRTVVSIGFQAPLFSDKFELEKIGFGGAYVPSVLGREIVTCAQLREPRQRQVVFSGFDHTKERFMYSSVALQSHGFYFRISLLTPAFPAIFNNTVIRDSYDNAHDYAANIDLSLLSDAAMDMYVKHSVALASVPRPPLPVSTVEVTYVSFADHTTKSARVRRDATLDAVIAAYPGSKFDMQGINVRRVGFPGDGFAIMVRRNQVSGTASLRLDQVLATGVTRLRVYYSVMSPRARGGDKAWSDTTACKECAGSFYFTHRRAPSWRRARRTPRRVWRTPRCPRLVGATWRRSGCGSSPERSCARPASRRGGDATRTTRGRVRYTPRRC